MTQITQEMSLEEKLAAIELAVQAANGDSQKETQLIDAIIDPQDALQCDSCQ